MSSSSPSPPVGDQAQTQLVAINYGVILAAFIFLSMVVFSIFLLHLYAKRFLLGADHAMPSTPSSSSSSRFLLFSASDDDDDEVASPLTNRGLPAAVLRALPVTLYKQTSDSSEAAAVEECAVCLSEVVDGERVRSLPKCGHAFHADCIDAWFRSRDTCPLCRAPVAECLVPAVDDAVVEFPAVFPTNVLFWGTQNDVTTAAPPPPPPTTIAASSGRRKENDLVIDVPTRAAVSATTSRVATTSSSSSSSPVDEPWSPVSARFRTLRRLLSRGKRAVGVAGTTSSTYTPRSTGDVEQGFAGAEPAPRPAKTATMN